MSSYCSVEKALKSLAAYDSKLTIDTLMTKAASKAFVKVFKLKKVDVSKISKGTSTVVQDADKLLSSQFKSHEKQFKGSNF